MTPKERYLACLRGEPMDYLPRVPILMQFAAEYIGSNYGAFASDYRVLAEANIRCAEDFGFDQLSAISDPYLAFGPHLCLGATHARILMRIPGRIGKIGWVCSNA